jgi:glycerophosphoryl diester phosphodiesterase
VADASPDLLRNLRLRDQAGTPTGHVPLLITDLADLLSARSATQPAPQSVPLQLDMKNSAADLTEADIAAFTRVIGPVAKSAILSCGDATLVFRMHEAVPDLHIGYDPCHFGAVDAVLASGAFEAFVEDAVETMPFASMIYLEVRLILATRRRDFDIVGAFHRHGKTIDAYTINRSDAAILPDVLTLLDLGCDQITTDDPVGLERLVMTAAV